MAEIKDFKCVNCGNATGALYRNYGPSVLKLSKCRKCKGIVDKYIEYDKVIVMIDAVLISKEAQRHVIYNTEFPSYWKLFIVLMLLETYGVWRNDSLFNITINSMCGIQTKATINSTYLDIPIKIALSETWMRQCRGWVYEERGDDNDLFIWEKDFYIQFISTFVGIVAFISTVHIMMNFMNSISTSRNKVSITKTLKAFSMANVSILFTLPMLVWGNADTSAETRTVHYMLVLMYSFAVFFNAFIVLFESPAIITLVTLLMSYGVKYLAAFHATPLLRALVT